MRADGDGWVECSLGHRHWGLHGAAGLLLYTVTDGEAKVLMQHRAPWCHNGDTWGIPGGARDSHEDAVAAAIRESEEEAGIDKSQVTVHRQTVDDHGDWSYTTVVGYAPSELLTTPNQESAELRWLPLAANDDLPLHPGFSATWPSVRAVGGRILIDLANVVGSTPDGWWRDRAGASARTLHTLSALGNAMVRLPGGGDGVVVDLVAVVEGQASDVAAPPGIRVVSAPGSGDDTLVMLANDVADAEQLRGPREKRFLVVVTADRGLAARLPSSAQVVGPSWLRDQRSKLDRNDSVS
ncbi:MAG: NUDIX hydrolase [Candidatus Nanopelagicales bacterium]